MAFAVLWYDEITAMMIQNCFLTGLGNPGTGVAVSDSGCISTLFNSLVYYTGRGAKYLESEWGNVEYLSTWLLCSLNLIMNPVISICKVNT